MDSPINWSGLKYPSYMNLIPSDAHAVRISVTLSLLPCDDYQYEDLSIEIKAKDRKAGIHFVHLIEANFVKEPSRSAIGY